MKKQLKEEDVRIGNYAYAILEIFKINAHSISMMSKYQNHHLEGIEIHDFYLEDLGFIKTPSKQEWVLDGIRICQMTDGRYVYPDAAHDYVYIDYIHDLQNLFYALRKRDLKFNKTEVVEQ